MTAGGRWEFEDDRGQLLTAERAPRRVVGYIQAAAALWDHGVRPAGFFGSQHDGETPDAAKSGALPLDKVAYFGAGSKLRTRELLDAEPDLLVAVTYDGEQVYGIDAEAAQELAAQVPTVLLTVGTGHELAGVTDRFAALARSLGAADAVGAAGAVEAGERLRAAAAAAPGARVLALSAADGDTAYLARPGAWPDLAALAALGVPLAEPAPGPGRNWATAPWADARALEPTVVLSDVRANAARPEELSGNAAWRALRESAVVLPWNPEIPPSPRALGAFYDTVAGALGP